MTNTHVRPNRTARVPQFAVSGKTNDSTRILTSEMTIMLTAAIRTFFFPDIAAHAIGRGQQGNDGGSGGLRVRKEPLWRRSETLE